MRGILLHITFLLLSVSACFAQDLSVTDDALVAYKEGDFNKAKDLILQALEQDENREDPKVWNFKGHIFKQLYKTNGLDPNSEDRDTAVNAFKKSTELSVTSKFHADNLKALEYLSATYFNDAIKSTINIKFDKDQDPVVYFQKFKDLKLWMNPEADTTREELEFLKMLAQGFEKIHFEGEEQGEEFMEKAVEKYKMALEIDSMDYEANFNLAIVYYNEGAGLIGGINYETGFGELLEIQKKCVALFNKALPYMERADDIRPNRVETIKGLMFINRALNDFEKYLQYKVRLEEILKKK